MSIDIEQTLKSRFITSLEDNSIRRIIFWQDPDGEFSELVDSLCLDNVQILKLSGKNNFAVKQLLSEKDLESNFLVYNPCSYQDVREDWLLDIELYSEEFRADRLSMLMEELDIPSSASFRKAIKQYARFFDNQNRITKLKALGTEYSSAGQLRLDIMAVLAGTSQNDPARIIRAVLGAGSDDDNNACLSSIAKFGDIEAFWEMVYAYTGFERKSGGNLSALSAHILLTALSATVPGSFFAGLEGFVSEQHQSNCYALVNEWIHSDENGSFYGFSRSVEEKGALRRRFEALDVADMLSCEIFPCINECILLKFMTEISQNIVRADEIVSAVEKRRTMKWYEHFRPYYEGLLQVARMQQFYQEHITGFHVALYHDMWRRYQKEYYLMDQYYRKFITAYNETLANSSSRLQDAFRGVTDYADKLYQNWYLQELSSKWTDLVRENLSKSSNLMILPQQSGFYAHLVSPLKSSGRVFVIISDALRYEVAAELNEVLLRDTRGQSELSAVQGVLPTATKYGMAALLPHRSLEVGGDGKVCCDGLSTEGTANREKVLQASEKASVAVTYKTFIGMKQTEKRELTAGKNVIYIYHNSIDAAGEALATEDKVFDACSEAIDEIRNLVRTIVSELNGTNILITSDHGFLYSHGKLNVSDKAEKDYVSGTLLETDRRYIIAGKGSKGEHLLQIPMNKFHSDRVLMVPQDNIRFKTGGGMNYVHGGATLQEMMVPVITFKNMRTSHRGYVETSPVRLELISPLRKISNLATSLNFHQKEAVGGKKIPCAYSVFFSDAAGKAVSDVRTIIADRTSENDQERVFRETFTLKKQQYQRLGEYYLNIVGKESGETAERIPFAIDIASAEDLDLMFTEEKKAPSAPVRPAKEKKAVFRSEIYTIREAEEIYLKEHPEETFDGSSLREKVDQALEEQGYSLSGEFAVKGFVNAEEYFTAQFEKPDVLDAGPYLEKYGEEAVMPVLKTLADRSEIIEFERGHYINVRKLNEMGFRKKQLREYCDQVYEYGLKNRFFTVRSLTAGGMKADIDELGFGDVFYESLISVDSRFARTAVGDVLLFSVQTEEVSLKGLVEDLVAQSEYMEVDALLNMLGETYGIGLDRKILFAKIKDSALYYDKMLDYLYKDYETYYQDISREE